MRVDVAVLGSAPPGLVDGVAESLPDPLRVGSVVRSPVQVDLCWDALRAQADAVCLLDAVPPPSGDGVLVALMDRDLFISVLTFVFGASSPATRTAVLSWVRLRPEGEAGRASREFVRRVVTEVVHEAGHAFGLVHCVVPDCVMHRSLSPEAVDLKRPEFCPACLEQLVGGTGAARRPEVL